MSSWWKRGDHGRSVKILQRYLGLRADGVFGPQTLAGVRQAVERDGAGTIADRRAVLKLIPRKDVVSYLFDEVAPKFENREGGYTRTIKLDNRAGDNAPMSQISLVLEETVTSEANRATRAAASKAAEAEEAKADEAAETEAPAEETAAEESEEK